MRPVQAGITAAGAGGVLFGLSQVYSDYGLACWLSFVLLGAAMEMAPRPFTPYTAGIWALAGYVIALSWLLVFGSAPWLLLAFWQTLFIIPVGLLAARSRHPVPACTAVTAGAAFTLGEWLAGQGSLGVSMATAAGALARNVAAVQWAVICGAVGLTFLVSTTGLLMGVSIARRNVRSAVVSLSIVALVVSSGAMMAQVRHLPTGSLRAAALQGVTADGTNDPLPENETLQQYYSLSAEAVMSHEAQLVLWPETSCPGTPFQQDRLMSDLRGAFAQLGTAAIIGAVNSVTTPDGSERAYNIAIGFGGDGRIEGSYEKLVLTPFGEYVPGPLYPLPSGRWRGPARDCVSGRAWPTIPVSGARVGLMICSETMFSSLGVERVRQGADILAVLSNDSWFGRGPGSEQLARLSILRAVECRRSLARAAETGYSMMIGPDGRVLKQSALYQRSVVASGMPLVRSQSVYVRTYELWPFLIAGTGLSVMLARRRTCDPSGTV